MDKPERGTDNQGTTYESINDMWDKEVNGNKEEWYRKADEYWSSVDASLKGVLGGLDFLHNLDITESDRLLRKLFKTTNQPLRAIDCGAGIGRITQALLLRWFKTVDLVDQNHHYVAKAKADLGDKVANYYTKGLQEFDFEHKYDCIWIQWVASHLTDDDLVVFLQKCRKNLNPGGYIVVKENILFKGFDVDKTDYSVVRSDKLFQDLFMKAGLKVILSQLQPNFPQNLFKVNQYVLQ